MHAIYLRQLREGQQETPAKAKRGVHRGGDAASAVRRGGGGGGAAARRRRRSRHRKARVFRLVFEEGSRSAGKGISLLSIAMYPLGHTRWYGYQVPVYQICY